MEGRTADKGRGFTPGTQRHVIAPTSEGRFPRPRHHLESIKPRDQLIQPETDGRDGQNHISLVRAELEPGTPKLPSRKAW